MDEEQLKEYQERMKARWAQDSKPAEDNAGSEVTEANISTSAAAGDRDIINCVQCRIGILVSTVRHRRAGKLFVNLFF